MFPHSSQHSLVSPEISRRQILRTWCWLLPLLPQLTVSKTWACNEQNLQRGTVYFKHFLSLKRSLESRDFCDVCLSSQSLWWLDLGDHGPAWLGRNTISFSDMSTPGKLHKSFFSLASFLNRFCCRAPGRSSSERNWAQGKFLSDIFPPFPSGSSLPALHSLQPPPLPILNSNHRHRVSIIFAEEGGSGNNHLDIVVIRIYFLHWWKISHFLSCHKTNRIMTYVL